MTAELMGPSLMAKHNDYSDFKDVISIWRSFETIGNVDIYRIWGKAWNEYICIFSPLDLKAVLQSADSGRAENMNEIAINL